MVQSLGVQTEEEKLLSAMRDPTPAVLEALKDGRSVTTEGLRLAPASSLALEWAFRLGRPLVLVVPTSRDARHAAATLETWQALQGKGETFLLPAPDVVPYGAIAPDRALSLERMRVQAALPSLSAGSAVVVPAAAWARRVAPLAAWNSLRRTLTADDEIEPSALRLELLAAGYREVAVVEDRATFSVRGGILDVWPGLYPHPLRLDFYGDLLESIRVVDPQSQRGGDLLESVTLTPVTEEIRTEATLTTLRQRLTALGETLRAPSMRISGLLRELQAGEASFGSAAWLPAWYPALSPLTDLLPPHPLVVLHEPARLREEIEGLTDRYRREYERALESGDVAFAPEEHLWSAEDALQEGLLPAMVRNAGVLDAASEGALAYGVLDNAPLVRARKDTSATAQERGPRAAFEILQRWQEQYGRVMVICGGPAGARRVDELARRYELGAVRRESVDGLQTVLPPPARAVDVVVGAMVEGFRFPARSTAVITDMELLGKSGRRDASQEVREATAIASFRELQPGDLVVHTLFGIGRYTGLVRMDAGGYESDFLGIEYADKDRLYVPVYRLSQVQKYVGSQGFAKLDKLGGSSWERTKARVRKQLADVAEELLLVQAERAAREGRSFSAPDEDFLAVEASFPFEETPHQLQAIEEILADMQRAQPMDRLLCGDVGFGKTEVAVRAAWKAVLDGAQVALLVPTTVLAEQHLKTFRTRLSGTAARVEAISRFRSSAEVRTILADLEAGKVDVVIGTHRLLSKDVSFKDLGLLIIDEEQRFGVTHKERIKQLRSSIDVVTMTATPIPRTLELSLLGLRDLSVIMTPPPGRLAVQTHVARYGEGVLRDGILHELGRGGQVFIVHNRVETIQNVAEDLKRIVPTARIAVGHAQMGDDALEKVMLSVVRREVDILLSTTIIESGIDISSANTIFILDADRFGLSQLYQLRGRVGRGSERGVCYLLVRDPKTLSDEAFRRLEVLQQHTELGSGLAIAQQDLDMRGAGHLLGRDQSGHIESIGFELYAELLAEAVAELKGEAVEVDEDPEVKLPVPAYIPEDYIADVGQRLGFYKRLSAARNESDLREMVHELEDRFGPVPEPVGFLRDVLGLKILLRRMGARQIEGGPKALYVDLQPHTDLDPARVIQKIESHRGTWEFRPEMRVVVHLPGVDLQRLIHEAYRVAEELMSCLPERA